jgi:glycerol transport system permease protein
VLPVFAIVLFSALLPLMTVVNYSVQDSFGNNQFFWNGIGWFQELLDPSSQLGERFFDSLWRNLLFSAIILLIEVPLGIVVALGSIAFDGRARWTSLVIGSLFAVLGLTCVIVARHRRTSQLLRRIF